MKCARESPILSSRSWLSLRKIPVQVRAKRVIKKIPLPDCWPNPKCMKSRFSPIASSHFNLLHVPDILIYEPVCFILDEALMTMKLLYYDEGKYARSIPQILFK